MNQMNRKSLNAEEIAEMVKTAIGDWHVESISRPEDYIIVTDKIREIKQLDRHREDLFLVIRELAYTNTEMWHEEDKVRSERDDVVLKAIRNINPLNQHRNDLIEEIDEIFLDNLKEGE